MKSFSALLLTFKFQRALQANANEQLQIVCQACNKGQELLCYAQLPDASLLRL